MPSPTIVCDRMKYKEVGGEKIQAEKEKSRDSYVLFVFDMSEMNQSGEVKEILEDLNLEIRGCNRFFIILTYTYVRINNLLTHEQEICRNSILNFIKRKYSS